MTDSEDTKKISQILESFYREPHKNYGSQNSDSIIYREYIDLISQYVKPNARVLDIGSNKCALPVYIAKRGYEVFGCDFFPSKNSDGLKSEGRGLSCHIISGNGYSLPFKSESFDAVMSLTVLEHIVFVDEFLNEMNRVLKPNGTLIIDSPNWAGLNAPVRALISLIFARKRYWRYENINDAILGIFRSFIWYFKIFFSRTVHFVLIFPRVKDGKIDFKESDDDCVHLCHPLSFKKWLKNHNFKILKYNRTCGNSFIARVFNSFFPSFATYNNIVGRKTL